MNTDAATAQQQPASSTTSTLAENAALLAIEQQVRTQIGGQVDTITTNFGAYLASAVRTAGVLSALELLSRHDVHTALSTVLDTAKDTIEDVTRTGYLAAAQLAKAATARDLAPLGHDMPTTTPEPSGFLHAVIHDIRSAFDTVLFDVRESVRAAHDGVTGNNPTPARVLTTNTALTRAVRRLGVRVNAAGSTALHRGYTDAQLYFYRQYATINPYISVSKRWQVHATDPCRACQALDGTVLPLDAEFDHHAGSDDTYTPPPVYRDLYGPPRHPNCRCRLAFDTTPAPARYTP